MYARRTRQHQTLRRFWRATLSQTAAQLKRCLGNVGAALHLDGARHTGTTESILNFAECHVACPAAIDFFEDITDT